MRDFLLELSRNSRARKMIQSIGLPIPLPQPLVRERGAWQERPLFDRDVAVWLGAGGAVMARRGIPHAYRNAGAVPARYLLVMTPRIAHLVDAVHEPGADFRALFAAHDSELLA